MRLAALLLCALVGSAAAADLAAMHEAKVSGARAMVSGARTKFLMKHPLLSKHVSGSLGGGVATPTTVPTNCLSVAEVAQKAGNFTALLAAAEAAGLASALSDRALVATVFAPTDAAFSDLLDALEVTAEELLAEPELLQKVLKYHVVPGAALTSGQLSDMMKLDTLLSADLAANATAADIKAHKKPAQLTIDISKVYKLKTHERSRPITVVGDESSAEVIVPDVNAGCPAVVHVIDTVLLPTLKAPAEEAGMAGAMKHFWGM